MCVWRGFCLCCRVYPSIVYSFCSVHRKTNFLVNLYWENQYSDSDSDLWMVVVPSLTVKPHPDWSSVTEPSVYIMRSCGLLLLFFE